MPAIEQVQHPGPIPVTNSEVKQYLAHLKDKTSLFLMAAILGKLSLCQSQFVITLSRYGLYPTIMFCCSNKCLKIINSSKIYTPQIPSCGILAYGHTVLRSSASAAWGILDAWYPVQNQAQSAISQREICSGLIAVKSAGNVESPHQHAYREFSHFSVQAYVALSLDRLCYRLIL